MKFVEAEHLLHRKYSRVELFQMSLDSDVNSTVKDKVLIKLLKAFSYREKCTAVNIKFDLPKVQEIELGAHSVWCQWGFWQYSLAPEPWGFLCPLFSLHMERQRKKEAAVISM